MTVLQLDVVAERFVLCKDGTLGSGPSLDSYGQNPSTTNFQATYFVLDKD